MKAHVIFFGSFGQYSAIVLEYLLNSELVEVKHVVTTPPHIDRKGKEQKNPVQMIAEKEAIPFSLTMPSTFKEIGPDFEADFIITAGYGKLLPPHLLSQPKHAALNLHFSLLPKYRGANPGEWAILMNETETGITIIEMNEEFDKGGTVFSAATPISKQDTRESIYEKLYHLGGRYLPQVITDFQKGLLTVTPQPKTDLPYASRFTRDDGFVSWEDIEAALQGKQTSLDTVSSLLARIAHLQGLKSLTADFIERAVRALHGFPSVWTLISTVKGEKRMKLHSCHLENGSLVLDEVQIEGQAISKWNQVKNSIDTNK